ncbi:MAG: sodium:solute symporter [Saprospiraceae bacterium]|nr:sodium:solute symporter [Saprospiraceae bacterium]
MNYLDYIVVGVYIVAFLFLGRLFKDSKSGQDYFLGGKSFGWASLSLSTIATQLSAISFISAPAFVGLKDGGGMMWLTYEFAVPLAMLFLMVFLIPPMYKAGIVSVYEYLERRFSTSTRVLLSLVFQISRAFATSVMVYTVALILTSVMDFPMWQTILIIGVVTLIYSYQGGMKAVVYGDVIQMIILFGGIVICLVAGLHHLGGWGNFVAQLDPNRLQAVNFQSMGLQKGDEFGFWPMLLGGLFLYTSYYGTDQSQVQRLFSAQDLPTVKKTLLSNGLMRFPITLTYCIMGLVIGTLVATNLDFRGMIPVESPDLMIPIFIREYLPHGIIGILMVAIFSAAMSSLSSGVNSLSAASVEDFFNRKKQLNPEQYISYSKYATLFWGGVCIILAFFTGDIAATVIEAINKVGSVFYGPILATFIAAIGISRVNARGANLGILAGVGVNLYLWLGVPEVFWFWWNLTGAVTTLVIAYVSSLLWPSSKATESIASLAQDWRADLPKMVLLVGFFIVMVLLSMNIGVLFQ